jgi:hypothetical protein
MKRTGWLMAGLIVSMGTALADEVTYRKDIRPLWERQCSGCHGTASPYLGEFDENKDKYEAMSLGPRMDTYADLLFFVAWPDTGAIMRRLDDGRLTQDGKPGNMYVNLGATDEERQKHLALFKAWVGEGAWVLKKKDDVTKEELLRIKAEY